MLKCFNIYKSFDDVKVLNNINLNINNNEFFTLLGPSGGGKSTMLRLFAGLDIPNKGNIYLNNKDITYIPANKRNINTVFQSYALFPHLNVYENIAFGLKTRKFKPPEVKNKVNNFLEILDLVELKDRYIHQISGGQKQRVALARALVNEPELLLLDEPMSALDARLRSQVQEDLRRIQKELKQTFILVTHDQEEALTVSDRIAIMNNGIIEQLGSPQEVYLKPKTKFVANFLGAANILNGEINNNYLTTPIGKFKILDFPNWRYGNIAIRPEHIKLCEDNTNKENIIKAKIKETIYRGQYLDLLLDIGLRIRTTSEYYLNPGAIINAYISPNNIITLN